MELFFIQIKAILVKNYKGFIRDRLEVLRECIPPLIVGLLLISGNYIPSMSSTFVPLFLPMSLNGVIRRFMINFVNEKSEKYKETQKIMGLRQSSYMVGWLLDIYTRGMIMIVILFIFVGFSTSIHLNFGICLGFYIIFTFAAIHFACFLTCFFSDPKLCGEIGTLIMSLSSLLYFLMYALKPEKPFYYYLISVFPFPAITFSFLKQDSKNYPFLDDVNENIILAILISDAIVFLILYFYLDLVKILYI